MLSIRDLTNVSCHRFSYTAIIAVGQVINGKVGQDSGLPNIESCLHNCIIRNLAWSMCSHKRGCGHNKHGRGNGYPLTFGILPKYLNIEKESTKIWLVSKISV